MGDLPHGDTYTSQSTHARPIEKQGVPKPGDTDLGGAGAQHPPRKAESWACQPAGIPEERL